MSLSISSPSGDGTPVTLSESARKPYGQTCAECARGKVKCGSRSVDGRCQRCHRLNKQCTPSIAKRRLKPADARKSTRPSQRTSHETSRMEQKLEELMTLLKPPQPTPNFQLPLPTNDPNTNHLEPLLEISTTELSAALPPFRERLHYLPFVSIPQNTTAQDLRTSSPYLSLAILTIESKIPSRQTSLLARLRHVLADQLLCHFHSSLDLLEAVLALLGWFMYFAQSGDKTFKGDDTFKPAICMLSQVAVAVVFDLGLNKTSMVKDQGSISLDFGPVATFDVGEEFRGSGGLRQEMGEAGRGLREARVVLGCFLVTSVVSTGIKRIDSLRWTQHMGECLRELESAKACLLDLSLVQQVRAQLVVEKAALGSWYDKTMGCGDTPPHIYAQALHAELAGIEAAAADLSPFIRRTAIVHCRATHLAVNEMAVTGMSTAGPLSLVTLRLLNDCVETIHQWFQVFLEIPASEYPKFSIVTLSHLKQNLGAAFALCTLSHPAWDQETARERLEPVTIVARVTEYYTEASRLTGLPQDRSNIFWRVAKVMRMTQQMWVAKLGTSSFEGAGSAVDGFDFASFGDVFDLDLFSMDWLSGFN